MNASVEHGSLAREKKGILLERILSHPAKLCQVKLLGLNVFIMSKHGERQIHNKTLRAQEMTLPFKLPEGSPAVNVSQKG